MNISKLKNRQEICRVVITSFKKRRIRTLGNFMSYLWNGRQRDVVPKSVMTSLTCRTLVLLIKPVDCLLWRSLCLTKVPKNVMACRTHVFLIKQIACLFVCLFLDFFFVLHVRSCCNHGNLPTVLSLRWRLCGPEGILTKSWTWYPLNFSHLFSELWTWVYPKLLETDETRISDQKIRKIFCTWSSHPQFH